MVKTGETDMLTEEKIFNAATAVFEEKGFAAARMKEIADKAGINKALLHYYFHSKDQLFKAVFQPLMKKMFEKIL
ncbi:MAG: TetR/AcrR family transcriptional regulator, partial [Bacteroidia bacterium]